MGYFISKPPVTVMLILVTMLGSLNFSHAQGTRDRTPVPSETLMTELGGTPIYIKTDYVFDGTPYFPEEYAKAIVILKSGKTFVDLKTRMNFYDNSLVMQLADGTELVITGNVSKVIYELIPIGDKLKTVVFQRGFPAVNNFDSTTYYEVLDSGKVKLLKHSSVSYSDTRGYGEASMTRVFKKKESYYLLLPGNNIKQLEKGKNEFLSMLPDKRTEMERYIEDKKLKCKKEEDWTELVAYYNSIN
ncbi:MAG: hypothetical protein HOP10_10520 [Chitinophagaceae bacterium]|nr:hypothetical protein [Chitinophagaceae bacterium]